MLRTTSDGGGAIARPEHSHSSSAAGVGAVCASLCRAAHSNFHTCRGTFLRAPIHTRRGNGAGENIAETRTIATGRTAVVSGESSGVFVVIGMSGVNGPHANSNII